MCCRSHGSVRRIPQTWRVLADLANGLTQRPQWTPPRLRWTSVDPPQTSWYLGGPLSGAFIPQNVLFYWTSAIQAQRNLDGITYLSQSRIFQNKEYGFDTKWKIFKQTASPHSSSQWHLPTCQTKFVELDWTSTFFKLLLGTYYFLHRMCLLLIFLWSIQVHGFAILLALIFFRVFGSDTKRDIPQLLVRTCKIMQVKSNENDRSLVFDKLIDLFNTYFLHGNLSLDLDFYWTTLPNSRRWL